MVIYCVLFIFTCVLAFVLACIAEVYSERAKKKASVAVKTEAVNSRSFSYKTQCGSCDCTGMSDGLKNAG